MEGNVALLLVVLAPLAAAPLCYALGRKSASGAVWGLAAVSALCLLSLGFGGAGAAGGAPWTFVWPGFGGFGLRFRADGFRWLYALLCAGMWLGTSLFSKQYMAHGENVGRYACFTLLTLGAALGVLLADSLLTLFVFFEMLSLASYPWVAHEEDPAALKAAQTYLYVAIIGGLVTLMGLFLLPGDMARMGYENLRAAAQAARGVALWLPAALTLVGFAAKAGAFPLHIWLPKAHPVAPAPASALLSGMLTKAGVLGALVLSCKVMAGDQAWGELIFWLGMTTMLLGAVLALFSVNLKRTLACSSLSQIGFIWVGIGLTVLMGHENGFAAWGTAGHMLNHSLLKLVLFMAAGVVALNAHALELNDVRGFGRKKPLLHFVFLMGLLGISGVPGWNGFASKSLLHEALLEYGQHLAHAGHNAIPFAIAEKLFLLAGGMTFAYMLKLYICLFWQKHPQKQAMFDGCRRYMTKLTAAVLGLCALLPPLVGLLPGLLMDGIGRWSQAFFGSEGPAHSVHYFSGANLLGAATSLGIGLCLCLAAWAIRRRGLHKGKPEYANGWPAWLDLEEGLYRPLLRGLTWVGYQIAHGLDRMVGGLFLLLKRAGIVLGRLLESPMDALVRLARATVLAAKRPRFVPPVGNRLTFALGSVLDGGVWLLNKTLRRKNPIQTKFVTTLAAGTEEMSVQAKRLARSMSFGLLMFCLGLLVTLAYLWFR